MFRFILIFTVSLLSLSCRSEAKLGDGASRVAPSEKRSPSKLTPSNSEPEPLRLGIKVRLLNANDAQSLKITKSFNDQLSVFEPCLSKTGKGEVVRLSASFHIDRSGLLSDYAVIEVVPDSDSFKGCFTSKIGYLRFSPELKNIIGELSIGTFYGSPSAWLEEASRQD